MKNKRLIYILIPIVLIVWGLIIFKIINHFRRSKNPVYEIPYSLKNNNTKPVADSSSLFLNYRDPFLRGINRPFSPSKDSRNSLSNNSNLTTVSKTAVIFPNTKYSGLVVNSRNKSKLGLLKIDNKDFLVKEGELVAGEKIIRLYPDSVIITFNKTKTTFLKTN